MQVSGTMIGELETLMKACLLGAAMVFCYDVLRIFRRFFSHGTAWVSVEDILYWAAFGLFTFLLMYREVDGSIRGYILGGIISGGLIYYALFGRWLVRRLGRLIFSGKKRLKKAWKAVTIKAKKRFEKKESLNEREEEKEET